MLRFLRKRHSGLASSNGETKHLMPRVFKGCNTRYFLFNFSYGDKVPRSFLGRLFAIAWTLFGLVLMTFLLADITNALISYSMQRSVNKKVYGAKVLFNYDNTKKGVLKKKILLCSRAESPNNKAYVIYSFCECIFHRLAPYSQHPNSD